MTDRCQRVVVTGAAGMVGTRFRTTWRPTFADVTYTDIQPAPPQAPDERFVVADLDDRAAVGQLMEGTDGVIHLGGISKERGWDELLHGNIEGTYNVYEAARKAGVRRVIYASSLHVTGFYSVDEQIGPQTPPRPSGLYGVTKAFGEALARLYWDKFGIESLVVRLGTFADAPNSARALRTWMSPGDFISAAARALTVEKLGFQLIYGMSANSRTWWTNPADVLDGWQPRDSADAYAGTLAATELDPSEPEGQFQGAGFAAVGHFDDGPVADPALAAVFGQKTDAKGGGGGRS